ncbi:MAG: hypothetical protein ACR2NF_02380 [Pirellulales bacterium]
MSDGTLRHTTELIGDRGSEFLRTQRSSKRPFCLNLWFNAGHAEDRDQRPGIGHYPWPRVMNGKCDDITIPSPRLSAPETYEATLSLSSSRSIASDFTGVGTPRKNTRRTCGRTAGY